MVTLTDRAREQLQASLADKNAGQTEPLGLRVLIEKGGCAGWQYVMKYDRAQPADNIYDQGGVNLFIDPESMRYLDNAIIDYNDELGNSGFRVDNPQAERSCGCGSSFKSRAKDFTSPSMSEQPRVNYFAWTLLILSLSALAIFSWIFSFYVFGNPEKPLNYKILTKLEKLEPPKRFQVTSAPPGDFLIPRELYNKYYHFNQSQLKALNARFKRNYIENYQWEKGLVPYATGVFRIYQVRSLGPEDVFPYGIVVRAVTVDFPQVIIEHVFPTPQPNPPQFRLGDQIVLERATNLSAILHIHRETEDRLVFTIVPLRYGKYAMGSDQKLELAPPSRLNMTGKWPITDDAIGAK